MTGIVLRELVPADLDRVMQLEQELFGAGAWSPDMLRSELAAPGRRYVAAVETDEGVVGYAGVALGSDAEVMTVGVSAGWRRRGIGTALLAALLDAARAGGARRVFLEVRVTDADAQRLYQKAGFRSIGVRPRYYQPEGVDALVMRLDLSGNAGGRAGDAVRTGGAAS